MVRVTHIITDLTRDGAEMMLYRLLSNTNRDEFPSEVISLTTRGELAQPLETLGVRVRALGFRPNQPNPMLILRLAQWLRISRPDILQTWMYHSDLIGGLAGSVARCPRVLWNIRHSTLDAATDKRQTIWTAKACAWLSHVIPARVVCCSDAAQRVHAAFGYANERLQTIPNGFDTQCFSPQPQARAAVRNELGIASDAPIVGIVGRFHPVKNHKGFIAAARLIALQIPEAIFVLCGQGVTWDNPQLSEWIDAAGIRSACRLIGQREDMARVFTAMDLLVSASLSEGFSNVIGEAMACGTPCVVTAAGDSASIVGNTGRVAQVGDTDALASAVIEVLRHKDQLPRLGAAAQSRISEHFTLTAIVQRYQNLYRSLATAA